MARIVFKRAKGEHGLAMVEFAIALPLLLLLLLAIAEFGRMLYQYNILLQASRDASRYATSEVWNTGGAELGEGLKTQIKNIAVYGGPPSQDSLPVLPGLALANVQVTAPAAEHVQVTITHAFLPLIGNGIPSFIGNGVVLNFPLVATTVMRVL